MPLTFDQLDKDMGDWHSELEKNRTPVAPPTPVSVSSEITHLTGDAARKFMRDNVPQKIMFLDRSSNSNAQAAQ